MRNFDSKPQIQQKNRKNNYKGNIFLGIILLVAVSVARIMLNNDDTMKEKITRILEKQFNIEVNENGTEKGDIEVCKTVPELVSYVEKNLLAKNTTITVKINNELSRNDILEINNYINPCWGSCRRYKEEVKLISSQNKEIDLHLELSDEVYVYDAICNGGDISQAPETAQKLYKAVKKILNTEIKPSMSDYKKELAFYKYLLKTCKYNDQHVKECRCSTEGAEAENKTDPSHTAYGALIDKNPVCSGYARAMHLLLACEGINAKIISGKGEGEEHCWNIVELDGKWYQLDVTWDDNDATKNSLYYYFNITDDMMYGSHIWNKTMYPAATGKKYNYYRIKKRYYTSKKKFKDDMYQAMIKSGNKTFIALLDGFDIMDKDMEILFKNNTRLSSVRWKIFRENNYNIIKVTAH